MTTASRDADNDAIEELQERLSDCQPEADDTNFILNHQTLRRYLVARDWNVDAAEKLVRGTLDWRRETKPQHVVCTQCQKTPGYHAMRQVGFDKEDRPVLYSSFVQCSSQSHSPDDSLEHVTYLMENAARSLHGDAENFVWVIDFTGMKIASCNPKIGLTVERVVSAHYPERLGRFVIVNHGLLFHTFWRAAKGFMCPKSVAKACIHRSFDKVEEEFEKMFPDDLKDWLLDEIKINMTQPFPASQLTFWKANGEHDPRGCASYIRDCIDSFPVTEHKKGKASIYLPHQNILDEILCETK